MLEALLFQLPADQKSEHIRFPPYSAHIDFEFYTDSKNREFIRILYLRKPIKLDGNEFIRLSDFKKRTDWLRLNVEEWNYRKVRKYSEPEFADDEIGEYIQNPRKCLKI